MDAIVVNDELREGLRQVHRSGRVDLMLTHVQIDEILNTPGDHLRRDRLVSMLAEIPARRIPTYDFIIGLSRLGNARVTDDDGAAFIEVHKRPSPQTARAR